MEIIQLHLKHFGKFTDYRIDLHTGINIISGANESGKSTLHAFVKAMLYGITRTRSRSLDEYQLREPWENPSYFAGSMKLLYEGKIYRIDRNFHRREESVEVVCETDGTEAEDPLAAIRYFTAGLAAEDFDNTVFIRQARQASGDGLSRRLRDYLVNCSKTADESLDISAAQEFLRKKRKKVESRKHAAVEEIEKEIRQKTQESEYVSRDLERMLERRSKEGALGEAAHSFERIGENEPAGQDQAPDAAVNPPPGVSADASLNPPPDVSLDASLNPPPGTALGAASNAAPDAAMNLPPDASQEPEADDEPVETAGVLLPAMVLLSLTASGLMLACAFLAAGLRMRIVTGAGALLSGIVAVMLVWRLLHPMEKSERLRRRLEREAFWNRHLGFREDPEDAQDMEMARQREARAQEALVRAQAAREQEALMKAREREQEALLKAQALKLQEMEDAQRRGKEVEMIARTQLLDREISLRREKLDTLRAGLEELYRKKAGLSEYDEDLRAIGMAESRIRELAGTMYHESGAEFAKDVSRLLSELTGGKYTRISLDEKMVVQLNTPERLLSLEQVSYGTMQQVYFALRLTSALLLTEGKRVPILLDEPFAMYDDDRLERAVRFLSECGRQVILFSCQRRELEMVSKIQQQS